MTTPYLSNTDFNEDQQTCRECLSSSFFTDVAQGDAICTNCGVVAQSHIPYAGPDWREPDAADSSAKVSSARCGGVLIDESKYYGGLEPTTMSTYVYGGIHGCGQHVAKEARLRQSLVKTHKVVEALMEKRWKKQIEKKKFLAIARKRKREERGVGQDEEDTEIDGDCQIQDPISTVPVKWSLYRALLLHGNSEETSHIKDADIERAYLRQNMDPNQRKISMDIYRAHKALNGALLKLNLAENRAAFDDIMDLICQFASKKRGFCVRGISSRPSKLDAKDKKVIERHKEWNKARHIAAVSSAFIYFVCKKHRLGRSLADICASFQATDMKYTILLNEDLIKPTHCSKAMNEIKSLFPDFVQTTLSAHAPSVENVPSSAVLERTSNHLHMNDVASTTNLVGHMMQKLLLPPTAVKAVTMLVLHCKHQQLTTGNGSGTKITTIIASVAGLVCSAGVKMQNIANDSIRSGKRKQSVHIKPKKRIKLEKSSLSKSSAVSPLTPKLEKCISLKPLPVTSMTNVKVETGSVQNAPLTPGANTTVLKTDILFSRGPDPASSEGRTYWYEWSHERTWKRSISLIERSCNVSGKTVQDYYKKQIYPRRNTLLELLQTPDIQDSKTGVKKNRAHKLCILLRHIAAAAPLIDVLLD